MATPRRDQFDNSRPVWIHAISRCVRRAFLCGETVDGRSVEHRKAWIEQRLRLLAREASCEVAGYAVMTNHLHVVLRMRPDLVGGWSAGEVVRRWLAIWPKQRDEAGLAIDPTPEELERLAANTELVEKWRKRLGDLSWTMKALKEAISRRANAEDRCSGAFWEGRFKSVPLLDQAALIACMAYVDLNPIRAQVAQTPETSRFTGAYERIRARQALRKAGVLCRQGDAAGAKRLLEKAGIDERLRDADRDADKASWLTPIACCRIDGSPLSLDDYLTLVDATGRIIRGDKRGHIPAQLAPILARLDIELNAWLRCMLGWRQFLGAAVGDLAARTAEAARRGLRWVQNRCGLFSRQAQPASG